MIWVIDASVAVRWFIEQEAHPHSDAVLERIVDEPDRFAVPELFTFEVFAVLQRIHPDALEVFRAGILPLLQGGLFRQPLTERIIEKAEYFIRLGLTGYDACYAALAHDLQGKWLTFDKKAHNLIWRDNVSFCLLDEMPPNWLDKV